MGGSNSVPAELQGTYRESKRTDIVDFKFTEFEYKLVLKESSFELTQTQTNNERKPEGGGGSFQVAVMALLEGAVEEHGDSKKGEEVTISFKTKEAKYQEGGGMMGIPLPNDDHKVDFVMKYSKISNERGSFNGLSFVTYPKLKFDKLEGVLLGKKI